MVGLPSLIWSSVLTATEPAQAYFVTTARAWELALGAALALAAPSLRQLPPAVAALLGWSGLAAIVASGLFYSVTMSWPGRAALLPTLGAAAVIVSGCAARGRRAAHVPGTRPLVWIGGLSYSLYLWHWPMIVTARELGGDPSPLIGLAIVVLSFVPAWLTHHLVENPLRHSSVLSRTPRLALGFGGSFTLLGVAAGLALVGPAVNAARHEPATVDVLGAAALGDDPSTYGGADHVELIVPEPLAASQDVPDAYAEGCQSAAGSSEVTSCHYGDRAGEVTIALVGDSKALQWISAIDRVADARSWRVVTFTKSGCAFTDAVILLKGRPYNDCAAWMDAVHARLLADPPDIVITSQVRGLALNDPHDVSAGESRAAMVAGLHQRWSALASTGVRVVVLRDNPGPPGDVAPVYECVAEHLDDLQACAFDRHTGSSGAGDAQAEAAEGVPGISLVDLTDYVCPAGECLPVIGNVLVYRQGSHLTKTYVDTLASRLDAALTPSSRHWRPSLSAVHAVAFLEGVPHVRPTRQEISDGARRSHSDRCGGDDPRGARPVLAGHRRPRVAAGGDARTPACRGARG
jgi:hypothetical protein